MRIASQTTLTSGLMLLLGILMLVMPAGMINAFSADGPVPAGVWAIAAIFGPLGLLIAWLSAKRLVTRVRFGRWELECPDGGGTLGVPLEITLLPPQTVTASADVECTLTCFASRPAGARSTSGGHHRPTGSSSQTLFDTSWTLRPASVHPRTGVPIVLPLPDYGLLSQRSRARTVEWKFSVRFPAGRTTHEMEFEIPVTRTAPRRDG
jgi:hypothetical protein